MKTYRVEVYAAVCRLTCEIEADTENEAKEKARERYWETKIKDMTRVDMEVGDSREVSS